MSDNKKNFSVSKVRWFLETGSVVLVSSRRKDMNNIMTMGWHMVISTHPSLIACYIWDENYSFDMIRKSKECVINIPTEEIAKETVLIGNCSGKNTNKFEKFNLTPISGEKVKAPIIKECYANFECELVDSSLIKKYNIFIFEVVKGYVSKSKLIPKTIHYRGDGVFMISGKTTNKYKKYFKKKMLSS